MRSVVLSLCLLAFFSAPASSQTVTVTISAQQSAEKMARRGILSHCGGNAGRREGVGFSPVSADAAIKNCCFWGRYRVREIGVARGHRGWYACVRYE
jgi:hypothetical protein